MFWLLIAVGLLLAISLVPVSVEVFVRTEGGLKVEAIPRWGRLPTGTWRSSGEGSLGSRKKRPKKKPAARKPRSGHQSHLSFRKVHALLKSDDLLDSLLRWMKRLVRILGPRDVRVHLRFGTGDPCDTGHLWGVLSSLSILISREIPGSFHLEPDFVDQVFDLDAHAMIRFAPLALLLATLGYFVTPAPWRALRNYMRAEASG